MIDERVLTHIRAYDESYEVDDYKTVDVEIPFNDWGGASLLFALNDGIFFICDYAGGSEILRQDLTALTPKDNFISGEKFVVIDRVYLSDKKEIDGSYDECEFYIDLISNYGTSATFQLNLKSLLASKDKGQKKRYEASIKFLLISGFNKFSSHSEPTGAQTEPAQFNTPINVRVDLIFDGKVKTPREFVTIFGDELETLKNYFTNINNYNSVSWGGLGYIKSEQGYNPKGKIASLAHNLRGVGGFPGGVGYGWVAKLEPTGGIILGFESDKNGQICINGARGNYARFSDVLNYDELFKTLFLNKQDHAILPDDIAVENGVLKDIADIEALGSASNLFLKLGEKENVQRRNL